MGNSNSSYKSVGPYKIVAGNNIKVISENFNIFDYFLRPVIWTNGVTTKCLTLNVSSNSIDRTCPGATAPTKPSTKAPTKPSTKAPTKPPTKAPTKPPTKPPTKAPTKPPTSGVYKSMVPTFWSLFGLLIFLV